MNSQNVACSSKNAILISDFRRKFKSSCRIYLSIFIKHDYFYISINTYFMALSISILCLGFWILSKDNALLSTKVRLLFYLSLAGLVISSSIQTESVAGIFLALATSLRQYSTITFHHCKILFLILQEKSYSKLTEIISRPYRNMQIKRMQF